MVSGTVVRGDPVSRAWGQLLDQANSIADSITLTLLERDPELYDQKGAELRVDVRETTRLTVRTGLLILAGQNERIGDSPKELWRDTGRRRARQGVPLEQVMISYAMGSRMLWEALVARHESTPEPARLIDAGLLIDAAKRVWSDLDVMNAVVIKAYRREHARLSRRDQQREQGVLDALLEGRAGDPAFVDEARAVLGIEAEDGVACVVALLDDTEIDGFGVVEDRLDRAGVQVRWHARAGSYVGLLSGPVPDEHVLVGLFEAVPPCRIGVAASTDGLSGFPAAYLLATRAAETLPRGEQRAVAVSERLPELLLAGSPQVAPLLLRQTIGPLLAQPEGQSRILVDTLEALLRHDGSPTHAAEELFCHRNTVIYRMKQIERLTGRSLSDPRDKLLLGLALLARG